MVRVSICIPTYKRPKCVKRLLDSVYRQTFTDFEVFVTDNSPDDSVKDIVSYYPQINYSKNKTNLGMTGNINRSFRDASGDYIKLMFSDDWFTYDDSLERFVKLLDESDASFAFCGSLNVGNKDSEKHIIKSKFASDIKRDPYQLFLGNQFGAPSATIYKRRNIKYDENLKWLVDFEFYMRYLAETESEFVYTEDTLVSIGLHEEQVTKECIDDVELDITEHVYIYNKFKLNQNSEYRKHLYKRLQKSRLPYSFLKKLEISFINKLRLFFNRIFTFAN